MLVRKNAKNKQAKYIADSTIISIFVEYKFIIHLF